MGIGKLSCKCKLKFQADNYHSQIAEKTNLTLLWFSLFDKLWSELHCIKMWIHWWGWRESPWRQSCSLWLFQGFWVRCWRYNWICKFLKFRIFFTSTFFDMSKESKICELLTFINFRDAHLLFMHARELTARIWIIRTRGS